MSAKTSKKNKDDYIYSFYNQLEWSSEAEGYILTAAAHPGFKSATQEMPLNPDVSKEIEQFKEEYARWVRWYAYYHDISPIPAGEILKYIRTHGRGGFVCLDWEDATYHWAKEATKRYKYIGDPEERIWYLENFVTVPVSGDGHIILDPFLIGTDLPPENSTTRNVRII